MEKTVKRIALISFFVLAASVANAKVVLYPRAACAEIVSSEYSTGGGDSAFELYEILCKSSEGNYTTFITSWSTAAGFLGFGRAFHETKISLEPHDGPDLVVEE